MSQTRLSEVKKNLAENKLDAALISSIPNIIYLTDFSHFTEIEREAFLLITKNSQYIFTDARYSHVVKTNLKDFELFEISNNTPFINLLEKIITKEKIKTLGIEENNITVAEHKKILSVIKTIKHFDLRKLRIIKEKEKIEKIKKACEIGDKAFSYILKNIKLGLLKKKLLSNWNFLLESKDANYLFRQ